MQITGVDVDATRLHCNSVLCAIGALLGDYLRVETRKNLSPKVGKRSKRKGTCNVTIERTRFRLEHIEVRGKTQSRYEATMCRKKFVKLGRHGTRVTDYTVHRARCYHSFRFSSPIDVTRLLYLGLSSSFSCSSCSANSRYLRFARARLDPDAGP